ncbi:MAG: hypothetical protein ACXWF8_14470 [Methylobacter sp.]
MHISRSLIALAFSVLYVADAGADDMAYLLETTPAERAAVQTRFMKTKLNLSQDATAKVQAINLEYAEKVEPVLKGSGIGLLKMLDIKAIWQQKDEALRNALTPEQFDAYDNAKDELKQVMQRDLQH